MSAITHRARRRRRPARRRRSRSCTRPTATCARTAAEAVTAGLAPNLRTRAFVLNTLLADKATDDRLRHYDSWIASRNLVERGERRVGAGARRRGAGPLRDPAALVRAEGAAARPRPASPTTTAWRRSPTPSREIGWNEAKDIVLDAYASFSPELADTARRFFDGWIDAPARPGKRPGAFCAYTVPSHHPYVLLNWTSRRRDVLTLAHELGHGAARVPRARRRASSTRPHRSRWPRPRRCSARPSRSAGCSTSSTTRRSGSRCSRRTSRTRSRPCSARPR